jgi:hypothetical protein
MPERAKPSGRVDHTRAVERVRRQAAAADLDEVVDRLIAGADARVAEWFRAVVGAPERGESAKPASKAE